MHQHGIHKGPLHNNADFKSNSVVKYITKSLPFLGSLEHFATWNTTRCLLLFRWMGMAFGGGSETKWAHAIKTNIHFKQN